MESKIEYETNDALLVMQIRENNEEAKDHLYEKYNPLIHKEINRVKKRAYALGIDLADLSQEAMLAFSHSINNFKDEADVKFMTFAVLCIRRRLSNYISKFDTQKNKTMLDSLAIDAPINEENDAFIDILQSPDSADPLNRVISYETLKEVNKRIKDNLSDNEKTALQHDLDGKSVDEIASLMNMNTKQIYNLIYRARQKIKL